MNPLSSILRRPGAPRATKLGKERAGLKKVLFVSYGTFDCNSGVHIAGFAAELARRGLTVGVCAREPVQDAYAFGPPPFEFFTLKALSEDPAGVIGFDGMLEPEATFLICWTPRKASRRALTKALRRCPSIPYVIHFEDNEDHLSALRFGEGGEIAGGAEQDTAERQALLAGAAGATVIEERLKEVLPAGLPVQVLEPGVDLELFAQPLAAHRRASILRAVGAPSGTSVMVYPGNVHRANAGEMVELYRALRLLREGGRRLVLIKTGKDDVGMPALLGFDPAEAGVIEAGQLERPFLIDLLKCADLFVQPGAPGPFNDYRLPSKLPEFMAIGRPIILPATNVGLRLRDGEDALLLQTGAADEIAAQVERVLDDPALAGRLSAAAQAFARRAYGWEQQGGKLAGFLDRLHRPGR